MKKIVFLSLLALCLPWTLAAQSVDDDLYYVPSKKKAEQKTEKAEEETVRKAPENVIVVETQKPVVCTNSGTTTIVVKDKKGNVRDVDEYNRRYNSKEYDFSQNEDTLYIEEKAVPDPDGEWVNGFDGSEDDYEYAMRIIRFRNPRYAISISSPLYWDVVYGLNSWDWNVYTDGLYAYAFPTFTNRLWWDWRYNSYGWGWGWPYYGWNWGWSGWYSGWYGGWYAGWGGWYGGWGWPIITILITIQAGIIRDLVTGLHAIHILHVALMAHVVYLRLGQQLMEAVLSVMVQPLVQRADDVLLDNR